MMRFLLFVLVLMNMATSFSTAQAHTRSQSFSQWTISDNHEIHAVYAVEAIRATQLGNLYGPDELSKGETPLNDLTVAHLLESLKVKQNNVICATQITPLSKEATQTIRLRIKVTCPENVQDLPPEIRISSFFDVSPTHIHLARIIGEDLTADVVLREGRDVFTLQTKQSLPLWGFVDSGYQHVITGPDHVVFVLSLLLLISALSLQTREKFSPRLAPFVLSGFTVGHMAALGFMVTDMVAPHGLLIEIMIAFTIMITALEALLKSRKFPKIQRLFLYPALAIMTFSAGYFVFDQQALLSLAALIIFGGITLWLSANQSKFILPLLAIAFGVIHGSGFGSGFMVYHVAPDDLLLPVLGFNLGVEIAQIGLMVFFMSIGFVMHHVPVYPYARIKMVMAGGLFALGLYWVIFRMLSEI